MREVKPRYSYSVDSFSGVMSNGKDPHFGYEYWLLKNIKGNSFWALNYEHLDYLKRYIQAKIRERDNRSHWTMVEKLPKFIKSAKNRIELIKCIENLEKK